MCTHCKKCCTVHTVQTVTSLHSLRVQNVTTYTMCIKISKIRVKGVFFTALRSKAGLGKTCICVFAAYTLFPHFIQSCVNSVQYVTQCTLFKVFPHSIQSCVHSVQYVTPYTLFTLLPYFIQCLHQVHFIY